MKIGIFGGTFSPIHKGHLKIIKEIKLELNLDIVYFVPSHKTPNKKFTIEKISSKDRIKMVKKAIYEEKDKNLKVSNFELRQKGVSYTYKTIKHFREKYPNAELFWIMGEDRYHNFYSWEKCQKITKEAKVVVFRRSKKINNLIKNDKNVIYMSRTFFDISSTKIMSNLDWENIPAQVQKYIAKKRLYLKTIVFQTLKESRYEHSVAVSSHAKRLATKYAFRDVKTAELAGLVHDLFKLHSDKELIIEYKRLFTLKDPNINNIPLPALHGFVCALWLKKIYGINDKKMLNSIKNHTLATGNATKLDKIIFVADKISTDRKGDEVGKLRKLSYLSLDETYKKIVKQLVKKLQKRGIEIHPNTDSAYKRYVNAGKGKSRHPFTLKKQKGKRNN